MDYTDVCSGITGNHAVGLKGNEPALVTALGGNLLTFKGVVRIVTVGKGVEVDDQHYAGSHIPIGKYGKGLDAIPVSENGQAVQKCT